MAVRFDSNALRWDPAKVGLGTADAEALAEAAADPNPTSPACQASLAAQRTALMFQVLFTGLVLLVATATAIAITIIIYRIVEHGWDPATTLSAVGGVVTGTATVFLGRRMTQAQSVQKKALEDVGKYCGSNVMNQMT
jgi:hypothetical protein